MARPRGEKARRVLGYLQEAGHATLVDIHSACQLSREDTKQVVKRLVGAGDVVRRGEVRLPHSLRPCGLFAPARGDVSALDGQALSMSILTRLGAS